MSADETVKEEDASKVVSEAVKFEIKSFTDLILHDGSSIEAGDLLQWAATNGHLNIYQSIVEEVPDKNPKNEEGWTPLHKAAWKNHYSLFKYIMDMAEDKNPKDANGYTPLHMACMPAGRGCLEICQLILNVVEDKNPKDAHAIC